MVRFTWRRSLPDRATLFSQTLMRGYSELRPVGEECQTAGACWHRIEAVAVAAAVAVAPMTMPRPISIDAFGNSACGGRTSIMQLLYLSPYQHCTLILCHHSQSLQPINSHLLRCPIETPSSYRRSSISLPPSHSLVNLHIPNPFPPTPPPWGSKRP